MIEPTDEMGAALLRALPADASWGWKPEDAKAWLADVLAIVERDYRVSLQPSRAPQSNPLALGRITSFCGRDEGHTGHVWNTRPSHWCPGTEVAP